MDAPYFPRPDTTAGEAMRLLDRGAMARETLATQLAIRRNQVTAQLRFLVKHGLIVRSQVDGDTVYHLPDRSPDDLAMFDDEPIQRFVDQTSIHPTEAAIRFANPFGLRAPAATDQAAP